MTRNTRLLFKAKDRDRKKQQALKKATMTEWGKNEKKRKEQEATQRQQRGKANARRPEAEPEEIGPYKSKNTLGKAVAKVIRALPGTPTRETHVLGAVLSSMPQDKCDQLCKTVRDKVAITGRHVPN